MAPLSKQLQKASFRGVEFDVLRSEASGLARRAQQHEYPKRDVPYVEDMGAQSAAFSVEAFVRWEKRRELLLACRQAGVGTLVLPLDGFSRDVVCVDCVTRDSTDSGGITRFQLSFLEAGDNVFPAQIPNTGQRSADAVDELMPTLRLAFVADFIRESVPQWVTKSAVGWVTALAEDYTTASKLVAGATNLADFNVTLFALRNLPEDLVAHPEQLASTMTRAMNQLAGLATDPRSALRMLKSFVSFGGRLPLFGPEVTPHRAAANRRRTAFVRLVRSAAAGEAARVAATIPLQSYDEAVLLRDELLEVIEPELIVAGDTGADDTHDALATVLAEAVRDLRVRGGELARVRAMMLAATVPAVVLAQRLYGDADRDQEIIDRNRIRHPLFTPAGVPLEVLSG